jgi:hypothetical protein
MPGLLGWLLVITACSRATGGSDAGGTTYTKKIIQNFDEVGLAGYLDPKQSKSAWFDGCHHPFQHTPYLVAIDFMTDLPVQHNMASNSRRP